MPLHFLQTRPYFGAFRRLLVFVFLLFLWVTVIAQKEQTSFSHLEIKGERFRKDIRELFEDSFGFLWVGTNNGLYRYDGNRVKGYHHDPFDPVSLPNNTINFIVEDENQNLWIASESYLTYFDRRREVFQNFFKGRRTTSLYASKAGEVWANVTGKGLLKIVRDDSTKSISFNEIDGQASSREEKMVIGDEFGRIWIGGEHGLELMDGAVDDNTKSGFNSPVHHVQAGRDQSFWVVSGDSLYRLMYFKGINRLETMVSCRIPSREKETGTPNRVVVLSKGKENLLWIGTEDGLYRINTLDSSPVPFRVEDPTQSTRSALRGKITAIVHDKYNNSWVGSAYGVVKIVARSEMFGYTDLSQLSASMSGQQTKAIFEDEQENIWIGTEENGLYFSRSGSGLASRVPAITEAVEAISPQRFGKGIFVAAGNKLFEVAAEGVVPQVVLRHSLPKAVMAEIEVSENEQWIGTWGEGLKIFNGERELPVWKKELMALTAKDFISLMVLDQKENVWIATRGNGIYRVSLGSGDVHHYQPSLERGVTSNAFLSLAEDGKGNVWLGTRGGGALLYDYGADKFTAFSTTDGLPSNTISALETDQYNNLWLSTPEGIAVYRLAEKAFYTLTTEDGIYENNFHYNSSSHGPERKHLYFGTTGGYYTIRAGEFEPRRSLAPTVITNLRTYGVSEEALDTNFVAEALFDQPRHIALPYGRNNVSIGFSSLDLTAPAKTKYAYRLKGINDYWIYPTDDVREAIYFDLPPGDYNFSVKSTNSDGVWNEQAATLGLKILPPFYLTTWAYLVYGALSLLIVWALLRLYKNWYRLRKRLFEERISREKNQEYHQMRLVFFTDISHELRTPLTLILGTVENWLKRGGKDLSESSAQRVYTNGLKMKQLINQLLDIHKHNAGEFELRVKTVNAVEYLRRITSTFIDHAAMNQLDLSYRSAVTHLDALLDPSVTDKIVGNLISNAIKYTPAEGKIRVTLDQCFLQGEEVPAFDLQPGKYVAIVVEDNGIGMDEQDLRHVFDRYYQAKSQTSQHLSGSGIGMELVHKLTKLHRGAITVESKAGEFTRFTVYLPAESSLYPESSVLPTAPAPAAAPSNPQPAAPAVPAPEQHAGTPSAGDKGVVLVTEDNHELRRTMVGILSDEYAVLEAANGREGFAQVRKHAPNVIITDLVMPVEGGLSLIKKVRADDAIRHLPIFVLTAKSSDDARKECLEAGATDFIEKPFSMEFLRWKIRNSLEQQESMQAKFGKTISVQSSAVELESPDERLIQDLIKLVEDNIENSELSVQFLAHEIGMSRANLYRKLKRLINDTPVSFIKKIRLDRAKKILEMNQFYVSEVAYMCGFSSRKYFTKCFQKAFDCSPSEYAEQHKPVPVEEEIAT